MKRWEWVFPLSPPLMGVKIPLLRVGETYRVKFMLLSLKTNM